MLQSAWIVTIPWIVVKKQNEIVNFTSFFLRNPFLFLMSFKFAAYHNTISCCFEKLAVCSHNKYTKKYTNKSM